mmetsp:Transcript_32875/g.83226  ORF Transcript_32875/g.83226 Transcript_32875/m.83226 type:complete len:215 (+) Transcript_32875:1140-1784(+)
MWNMGMVLMKTSVLSSKLHAAWHIPPMAMLSCVIGTILGFLVVPEVWSTRQMWSRDTVSKALTTSPFKGLPAGCFSIEKRPATVASGIICWMIWILRLRAAVTATTVLFLSSSPRVSCFCTTRPLAGRSSNSKSNSSAFRARLRGATVQRIAKTRYDTADSGPFGSAVQRRSSRPSPAMSFFGSTMKAFRSLKLNGCLPSVEYRNGSGLSGRKS